MAILVTGGAGYIGGHMVLALLDAGEDVVVLDDLSTGFSWAVPKPATLIVGDMGDKEKLAEIFARHKIEAIAHFAAKIVVPESVADPLLYYLNNTAKARNLIEAAIAAGIRRFIFSSTAAVYGEPSVNPITEEAPPAPINPYGRSKLMVEWMLEDVAKAKDFSYIALRYFNVAGADPAGRLGQSTPNATHLIKVAVQAALGHRTGMDVFGTDYPTPDGTCVRDYIQVSDLIAAHLSGSRSSARGRQEPGAQLRLWPRPFGQGSDRRRQKDFGLGFPRADHRPARRRSRDACRGRRSHPHAAQMAAALRQSRRDRPPSL